MDTFEAIHCRRSHPVLLRPGPAAAEVEAMLSAAQAAPDHGRQAPWRAVTLEGVGKDAFCDVMEKAYRARAGEPADANRLARERKRLDRAPLVIVMACVAGDEDRVPRHERLAATAAATQNLLLAATALGYGSIWRTGWPAADGHVKEALGFAADDDIVAFVYLGTAAGGRRPPPRAAAGVDDLSWSWPRRA
jgi:nitroreductase